MARTRTTGMGVALGLCLLATGCINPLFPDDKPRTQYDRYDRVRGDLPEARITDEHGIPRENVRARLLRKN